MKVLASLVLATALMSGCAALKGTTTHKVTVVQHSLLSVVSGFQAAEEAEHDKGFISADTHITLETGIQKVALAAKDLDDSLAAGASGPDLKTKVDAIYTLLDSLESDGLTGVKNQTSRQTLETALDGIKAIVDSILTQVK